MSLDIVFVLRVTIFPGFLFIFAMTMFFDWYERKIAARMQNRIGPSLTGKGGILQPLADFIKLLSKENIVPKDARGFLFTFSPIIAYSILVLTLLFIPIDSATGVVQLGVEGDLILVLILISIANFFLFLAGWSSRNPYGEMGAARILIQLIGYDIPLFILALAPAFLSGDLTIASIAASQSLPNVVFIPWVFVLFIITMQAELEKDPFDIPHAETEVVAGHETEYSGRNLAFLKLAKDVQIVVGAAIAVELFLGGTSGPVFFGIPMFWNTLWFFLKVLVIITITEYIKGIFARMRIDQVLNYNWKILLPLAIVSLIGTIFIAEFFFNK